MKCNWGCKQWQEDGDGHPQSNALPLSRSPRAGGPAGGPGNGRGGVFKADASERVR